MLIGEARGVDLEISETTVRINGAEVLVPEDAVIEIGPVSQKQILTATMTVFLNSLTIRSANDR